MLLTRVRQRDRDVGCLVDAEHPERARGHRDRCVRGARPLAERPRHAARRGLGRDRVRELLGLIARDARRRGRAAAIERHGREPTDQRKGDEQILLDVHDVLHESSLVCGTCVPTPWTRTTERF